MSGLYGRCLIWPRHLLHAAGLGRRALFERQKQTLGSACLLGLLTRPLVSLWGTEEDSHMATPHSPTKPHSPAAAAAAESLQPWPTLCDPTDGGPPGSPVPGILQARTLEWVAISSCSQKG